MARPPSDRQNDDETRLDDEDAGEATAHHPDSGVVAELRAKLTNGKMSSLPLYTLSDRMVVGRGKGCDWQIDDASLSRQHAELKWSGRELTVEDMGSQNGTRVAGKPARGAVKVPPGATIHLGTVAVVFQVKSELLEELHGADDEDGDPDATRLTKMPPATIPDTRTDIPIGDLPQPEEPREPQVFRPPLNVAHSDEVTQEWDARAALVRAPERGVGDALLERLRDQWKTNRRPFVLAGAAFYLILLVAGWEWWDRKSAREAEEEYAARMVARAAAQKQTGPVITPLTPENDPSLTAVPPAERELVLGNAITDFDQGHLRESLRGFRRLALEDTDEVAKFMVGLIEGKLAATAAPALPPSKDVPNKEPAKPDAPKPDAPKEAQ